ncbi:DNA-binding protein [Enterococcus canis]|uniref:DNA-binding protein n=1 Tax=Enterococcus canis TaxID=214095 RepID=A0A1L8RI72_9ENTE|nr:PRD domain-containing protein [Enterococcus canis]OJG19468.1 DNA-binding protein [Enterococcus canis]
MSVIEKRKQAIIFSLSNQRDYVTANELSRILDISTKTVYRLIKQINEEARNGMSITSEKGRGFKLTYDSQQEQPVIKSLVMTPIERRNKIMEDLLLTSPRAKNVTEVYESFYISETVAAADEKIIATILAKYQIRLIRQNRTLRVEGTESNIRKAVKDLIQSTQIIDLDQFDMQGERFNRYDAEFIMEQIRFIEDRLSIILPHPYNINIFSHLYILVSRFRKAGIRSFDYGTDLTETETAEMYREPLLQDAATQVIKKLENYLHTDLPKHEIYFLYQYLISSRMQSAHEPEQFSQQVQEVTTRYIRRVGEKLETVLSDRGLFVNLAKHIKPLINRLEHNIQIKNHLLEQIKLEYTKIFLSVEEVSEEVSEVFDLPPVSEDENGFLTLYFAQMVEEHPSKVKTLVMCTTGIGTSELLKVKISKKFPEIEIVAVISSRDVKRALMDHPEVDLIVSTVAVPQETTVASILISAMLTLDDQERLQEKLEELPYAN